MLEIRFAKSPRIVPLICSLFLFIALLHLPIQYYRLLRVVVFIGALLVVYRNRKEWVFWSVLFVAIAILFNPIVPIYLYKRSVWAPLDIIAGVLFLLDAFLRKEKKDPPKVNTSKKEEKTYGRDRIL